MVEPVSTTAAASTAAAAGPPGWALMAAAAIAGGASMFGSGKDAKVRKKIAKMEAKENKRRTVAQLLNEARNREFMALENTRESQNTLSSRQAQNLQDIAAGFRASLVGR